MKVLTQLTTPLSMPRAECGAFSHRENPGMLLREANFPSPCIPLHPWLSPKL